MGNRICPACDRNEKTMTPPYSDIVGSMPVHYPSGNVCMKHIPQAEYDLLVKRECRCGDSASSHEGLIGKCKICAWDGPTRCDKFQPRTALRGAEEGR